MDQLLFTSCTPPNWSIDAPVFTYHGNKGAPQAVIPGVINPTWGTMQLTGGWDPAQTIAAWMTLVSDTSKTLADKTCQVTVQFLQSDGTMLFQWVGTNGLLTGFSHSASDASSNGVLTVNATITAEKWELTK
jgi:hypothetical protein